MLAATTPPAPGTFSTTNGLPKAAPNLSARSLARTSGLPPGPEGAISRTGRVGQTSSCALTGEQLASETTQARSVAIFAADLMLHPRYHGRLRRSVSVSAPAQRVRPDCRYRHLQSRIAG